MIQLASPQPVTKHQTYIYQRNGVYYFRLRIRKARIIDRMTSVSLRTKDRRTAMATARHIKSALKAIHADNPDASYEELREHLRDIAEEELSTGRSDLFEPHMWGIYHEQYNELGQNKDDYREAMQTLNKIGKRVDGRKPERIYKAVLNGNLTKSQGLPMISRSSVWYARTVNI
ncbi:TPA: hypothetical protein PXR16_002386 [Yersinia enterocolitica]|nr:hypothetical protein [Yersinia enterocolitica]HEC4986874.1 hypothetical protein [Yersinia enterocolitica]HEN3336876.1 hypothetical protein [Yersinia enterocolitica]